MHMRHGADLYREKSEKNITARCLSLQDTFSALFSSVYSATNRLTNILPECEYHPRYSRHSCAILSRYQFLSVPDRQWIRSFSQIQLPVPALFHRLRLCITGLQISRTVCQSKCHKHRSHCTAGLHHAAHAGAESFRDTKQRLLVDSQFFRIGTKHDLRTVISSRMFILDFCYTFFYCFIIFSLSFLLILLSLIHVTVHLRSLYIF